jgi:hypothetical protein
LAEDGLSSLWETDLDVDESEIGAPVYSSGSRKIIGIARGKIWPSLKNYVIPIELAEPLLLTLRIKEIDTGDAAKIRDIESKIKVLQRQFNWFTRPDDSQSAKAPLRLCYEKFISGDPKPTSARISIRQSYIAGEKRESLPTQPERQQPIIIPALAPPSGPDGDCEGYFDLSDVVESAGDVKKMYSADKVDIQVDIIVTLSDGSTLPSKRIIVDGSTLPAKRVNFER